MAFKGNSKQVVCVRLLLIRDCPMTCSFCSEKIIPVIQLKLEKKTTQTLSIIHNTRQKTGNDI